MKFTSRFDPSRWGSRRAGLAGAALLLGIAATAVGELPKDRPSDRPSGRSLELATTASQFTMDRNRLIFILQENGEIGSSGSSVAGGGFWIATTNQYVFSSGINVGATIPSTGDTVVAIGGPFSQFPGGEGSVAIPGLGVFFASTDPADFSPPTVNNFPSDCTVDAFRVTQFPSLSSFIGLPFPGFADQTACIAVNDITGSPCGVCAGTRVGIDIIETMFVFGVPSVQDFLFVAVRVYNRTEFLNASNAPLQPAGPYDLNNTIVAFAADADIGDSGDDQFAFLPEVQTMVFWDSDFNEPQFQGLPGFGGITYLKTPVDPVTGEEVGLREFTVFTNGQPRPDPDSKEEWYRLMTGDPDDAVLTVTPQDVRGMAASGPFTLPQGQFIEIYGAYFFANVSGAPPALLLAEPYKNQQTGVIDPTANDHPAFDNFKDVQQTAQATFNAGFVVPTAPPKPAFTLIPGDGQVTIVWEGDPVESINAFAKVALDPFVRLSCEAPPCPPDPAAPPTGEVLTADQVIFDPTRDVGGLTGFVTAAEAGRTGAAVTSPAFDADFVIQDFQGFRVYRSRTGLAADAVLIAQFDLADAITGGLFCLAATAVFDEEGNFVDAVCTQSAQLPIGTNSGLAFSIVDRGGSFGTPADGPGLINGIPVFYTVTSFAVNCGQSPVDLPSPEAFATLVPPAACLVLETGLAPFSEATPRSNSTALQNASAQFVAVTGDGSDCDVSEPYATIDLNTGQYIDFIDCSNAILDFGLESIRGTNIPTGDFFFEIDSILDSPVNPYSVELFGGYQLAPATSGPTVWFHWEDASGNLATEFIPAVGSFVATYGFTHFAEDEVAFAFDTNDDDVGADASGSLLIASDFSAAEDLVVNGQSLALGQLGGAGTNNVDGGPNGRALTVDGSSLGTQVIVGNPRGLANSRAYSGASQFAASGHSFELTWSVTGNQFTGELRSLIDDSVIPQGGQPKGPNNPSTPQSFIGGYNWGFVGPGDPATVRAAIWPAGGPLSNTITLNPGSTFGIYVPGQSVYVEGITALPQDGDVWQIILVAGWDRGIFFDFGRSPKLFASTGPFTFNDANTALEEGQDPGPVDFFRGIANVFPGARWKLSLSGGSNELADADLSAIQVVPNPFVAVNEITRGRGLQRILFTNLPPQATIRIYTISGNLVRVLEHGDGSGTEPWDVRTRFDLLVASGNYYFHVTTPDGRTHLGRFAVIN